MTGTLRILHSERAGDLMTMQGAETLHSSSTGLPGGSSPLALPIAPVEKAAAERMAIRHKHRFATIRSLLKRHINQRVKELQPQSAPPALPTAPVKSATAPIKRPFITISTLFGEHITQLVSGESVSSELPKQLENLLKKLSRGNDYRWQMSTGYQVLQDVISGLNFWEIHKAGEDRLELVIDFFLNAASHVSDRYDDSPRAIIMRVLNMCLDTRLSDPCCRELLQMMEFKIWGSGSDRYAYLEILESIDRPSVPKIQELKKRILRDDLDPKLVLTEASDLIVGLPDSQEKLKERIVFWKEKFGWSSSRYATDRLSTTFIQFAERTLMQSGEQDIPFSTEQFQQTVTVLAQLRTIFTKDGTTFTDKFVQNVAAKMSHFQADSGFLDWAVSFLHENIYAVSDETAGALYVEIKDLRSVTATAEGAELVERLKNLPEARIPKMFKWIWRGNQWRTDTVRQMLKFHEMNPEHRLIVYTTDPEDFWRAADQVAAMLERSYRGEMPETVIERVARLKQKVEIRSRDVLQTEKIRTLLRNQPEYAFSKLDAIAIRNGDSTATAPLYAVVADIERLAVLHEEGGIYVDHNCVCKAPIHENARAEAGLAGQARLYDRGYYSSDNKAMHMENNAILAAPKNSPVIAVLLKEINDTFDVPQNKENPEHKLTHEMTALRERFSSFLSYDHHIPKEEKSDAVSDALTWSIGRFSNEIRLYRGRDTYQYISRADVIVEVTGPGMLSRVMQRYWQTDQLDQTRLQRLYQQAGGMFIVPAITKPDAPGRWARHAPAPQFTMDDARLPQARKRARQFRPYDDNK